MIISSRTHPILSNLSDFDRAVYTDCLSKSGEAGKNVPANMEDSMGDMFGLFFKRNPLISPSSGDNLSKVVENLSKSSEYKALHESTNCNPLRAFLAAHGIAARIGNEIDRLSNADENTPAGRNARRAINSALKESSEESESLEEILSNVGGGAGSKGLDENDPAKISDIMFLWEQLRNNPALKKIFRESGRMLRIAQSLRSKKYQPGTGILAGIERGGDISRLLPIELIGLKIPGRSIDTIRRIIGKDALQYSLKEPIKEGIGPIIHLVDMSGSMRDNDRYVWAHAVSLSLLSIAEKEKRDVRIVMFNKEILSCVDFPKGQHDLRSVVELVSRNPHNGTNFFPPIEKAIESISESAFAKADIILTTDGWASDMRNISIHPTLEKLSEVKKSLGVRIRIVRFPFVIADGPDWTQWNAESERQCTLIGDEVTPINVSDSDALTSIFQPIVK